MFLTPLTSLTWAYQLHYYLSFRTHLRRHCFDGPHREVLDKVVREICHRHHYHLLQSQSYPQQLRLSLSLRPEQALSAVAQTIKANSSRECAVQLSLSTPVWARGYLALSSGRMRIAAVRQYLESQPGHHGYLARILPPVFRYRAAQPVTLTGAHASFVLYYHLVFATWYRRGVFTSGLGRALGEYWLRVAAKNGFAIDQISVVPDHVHLLVRLVPKLSIEFCALSLMNNAHHFIGSNFPQMLIKAEVSQLWQPSAYAGTCGEATTALIKAWLNSGD